MKWVCIWLFGFLVFAETSECLNNINELASNDPLKFGMMVYYSGRDINDLGQYHECNALPDARYVLVMVTTNLIEFILGICGPSVCAPKDYEDNLKVITNKYEALSFIINSDTIQVVDPETYNSRPMGYAGIASVVLIGFIAFLVLVGTYIDEKSKDSDNKPRGIKSLLVSFSITSNFNKLITLPESYNHLQLFNGVRVIGMILISLGHSYVYTFITPIRNTFRIFEILRGFWHHFVFIGLYVVDVFFIMSGFLLAYLSVSEMQKRKGRISWVMFIVHRLIRIAPIYFFVFMIYVNILPYIGTGPAWPLLEYKYRVACNEYWWTNLLFINNFVPSSGTCMTWSWFIANDMQFYVLSPIILILFYKRKSYGYVGLFILLASNILYTGIDSYEKDYNPGVIYGVLSGRQYQDSYIKPYFRMSAYLIGMALGFVYRVYTDHVEFKSNADIELGSAQETLIKPSNNIHKGNKIELNIVNWVHVKRFRVLAYVIGFILMTFILFLPYNFETNGPKSWTTGAKALFLSTEHIFFSIGFIIILIPLLSGYGNLLLKFLTWKYFAVVAKISFSYYLVHPIFIHYYGFNRHQALYLQDMDVLYHFVGTIALSTVTSTVLTLAIESPILALEKKMFRKS
jgi:peptidoglycan/LPS O-acetylase OafA/YrhL